MARNNKQSKQPPQLVRANQLYAQGDLAGAIRAAQEGLTKRKNDPQLLAILGGSQLAAGYTDAAINTLAPVPIAGAPGRYCRTILAAAYRAAGRLEEAHSALDVVLSIDPRYAFASTKKAEILVLEGMLDDAEALLAPLVVEGARPDAGTAATWGQLMLARDEPGRAIDVLRRSSGDASEGEQGRLWPAFLLAQCLEKSARYDEAFEAYTVANALKNMRHSAAERSRSVDAMLIAWTRSAVEKLPKPDGDAGRSEQPVFIVGMMRSGSSLVEQVLSVLDGVHAAGELESIPLLVHKMNQQLLGRTIDLVSEPKILTQRAVNTCSARLLDVMRGVGGDADRITDKNVFNVFQLGFIAAMFPGARVIHCVRDPIDTCLSCYFQNFGSALSFAYDLQNIGLYYNDYRRTIAHWKNVLDLQIYDVVYEELVADPEPNMRALVDFVGLEWDERCLEFHKTDRVTVTASNDQVRRPMYQSSVKKWERYEQHLAPLIDAIDEQYLV